MNIRLVLGAVIALVGSGCGRDGQEGFACTPDGACDEGLTCVALEGRSLLNGRDRDVCRRPPRPPVHLRATTAPCCTDLYLGRDENGTLRIADTAEQAPLVIRVVARGGDGVTLNTTAVDEFGLADEFVLCVGGDAGDRVGLCLFDDVVDDEIAEVLPAALWNEISPARDGDAEHVSFRSVSGGGFLRHAVFELFAQADTGPPFNEDASWSAEVADAP